MLLDERPREGNGKPVVSNVEVCELSASVEAEWMRIKKDEAVCSSTKTILSFDLEQHHLVCGVKVAVAPFFLLPQPLLLN